VVRPEEVGERARWWLTERMARWCADGGQHPGPETGGDLHRDPVEDFHGVATLALVLHGSTPDLRTSLRSLLGLPAGADDEAVRLTEELAETRSKLAAADRAGEASRLARECLHLKLANLVGYPSDTDDARLLETLATWKSELGHITDRCIEIVDEYQDSPTAGPLENVERIANMLRRLHEADGRAREVATRISALVREHIVRTTSEEPALEGLMRIERALIEGGKARATLKRIRARRRRANAGEAKPKPARIPRNAFDAAVNRKLTAKPKPKAKRKGGR
jgi:hypothetical protein